MILHSEGNLLVSYSNGLIRMWEHNNINILGNWFGHKNDIIFLHFSFKHPVLISCDFTGLSIVWAIIPLKDKFRKLFEFQLKGDDKSEAQFFSVAIAEELKLIFSGDENGDIRAIDLSNLYELLCKSIDLNNLEVDFSKINLNHQLILPLKWKISAHIDNVLNISFYNFYPYFISSTSRDLMIKLWSAQNGSFIDSIRQGMKANIIPIGYKSLHSGKPNEAIFDEFSQKDLIRIFGAPIKKLDSNMNLDELNNLNSTIWKLNINAKDKVENMRSERNIFLNKIDEEIKNSPPKLFRILNFDRQENELNSINDKSLLKREKRKSLKPVEEIIDSIPKLRTSHNYQLLPQFSNFNKKLKEKEEKLIDVMSYADFIPHIK